MNLVDWIKEPFRTPVPPRHLLYNPSGGKTHFRRSGQQLFNNVRRQLNLKTNASVLDVGCGPGRLAIPLTRYLTSSGRYAGLDVTEAPIRWCQKKISPKFPNFQFHWIDVYNRRYAPEGKIQPSATRFSFEKNSFDAVVLLSVFTHMLPKEMNHYLDEIARVLKPGGQAYITFFLINDEAKQLLASDIPLRKPAFRQFLKNDLGGYRAIHPAVPEKAIAYEEAVIRKSYLEKKLEIVEPIHLGRWCGRRGQSNFAQDIVLARKPVG